jgi:hypothetical protein
MAQHDYNIANDGAAAVRSDINNALSAIVSNNSGATEPSTMFAYQYWYDTSTNILKQRNSANDAWISIFELDQTGDLVADLTTTDLTVSRALTNSAMRLIPGHVENLSMSLSAGVLTLKGGDGNDLSATNPAYVCTLSNVTDGKPILHTITSNQTLTEGDIDNNLLGFLTSVAVPTDVTLGVYLVANDSDASPTFMISRNLFAKITPAAANIGAPDDSVADAFGDFFSFSNIDEATYNGNACELVGLIRAQMDATDAWTIQALDNEKDGFGKKPKCEEGDWEFISKSEASTDASIDIALPIQYKSFKIVMDGIDADTSGGDLYLRFSNDNGATFETTSYIYEHARIVGGSQTNNSASSASQILIAENDRANGDGIYGEIILYNTDDASNNTYLTSRSTHTGTGGTAYNYETHLGARRGANEITDAVRFLFSSGNVQGGKFYLYGMKETT